MKHRYSRSRRGRKFRRRVMRRLRRYRISRGGITL